VYGVEDGWRLTWMDVRDGLVMIEVVVGRVVDG